MRKWAKISLICGSVVAGTSIYLVVDERALCRGKAYTVSCLAENPMRGLLLDMFENPAFDAALEKIQA